MNDVTRILSAIEQGDPQAAEQLLPLVYDELRKLASPEARPGEAGADAPGHGPGPRGVPPAGRWGGESSAGTAAAISSPRRPRPCAASWSRTPAASGRRSTAAVGTAGARRRRHRGARPPPRPAGPDEALSQARGRGPGQGRARQAPLLRRAVRGRDGRGPRHLVAQRPTTLGLRQGLAARRAADGAADQHENRLRIRSAGDAGDPARFSHWTVGTDMRRPEYFVMHATAPSLEEIFFAALEIDAAECPGGLPGSGLRRTRAAATGRALLARDALASGFLESPATSTDGHVDRGLAETARAPSSAPTSCWSRSARAAWASSTWPSRPSPCAARWP